MCPILYGKIQQQLKNILISVNFALLSTSFMLEMTDAGRVKIKGKLEITNKNDCVFYVCCENRDFFSCKSFLHNHPLQIPAKYFHNDLQFLHSFEMQNAI